MVKVRAQRSLEKPEPRPASSQDDTRVLSIFCVPDATRNRQERHSLCLKDGFDLWDASVSSSWCLSSHKEFLRMLVSPSGLQAPQGPGPILLIFVQRCASKQLHGRHEMFHKCFMKRREGFSGRETYKSIYYKANLRHVLGEDKVPRCSTEGEHGSSGGQYGEKGDPRKASGGKLP